MKRAADTPDGKGKRARRSLEFLGTCVSTVHLLSDTAAWKAAKAASASGDVQVTCIKECSISGTLLIQGSVTAPTNSSKVAAAAHTHPCPGQAQVQLLVDIRSGELLDADTSCCPGGYHAARGSFCPCVGALLLAAVKLQSLEHGEHQELALAHWCGTDALTARKHVNHMASKLQQLVQPGLLQRAPAELLQVVEEVEVLPAAQAQAKLKPNKHADYASSTASADVIRTLAHIASGRNDNGGPLLYNVACDLPQQEQGQDSSMVQGLLAAMRQRLISATGRGPMPVVAAGAASTSVAPVAAAAAHAAANSGHVGRRALDQSQLLAALGASHLTSYMGKVVRGWEQRPKVINWAFGLLLTAAANAQSSSNAARSSSSAAPAGAVSGAQDAKPLVALTGLLRVLWHCIHVEGLPVELRGVLLVAMALRNLLLVAALPLWARKAVAAQLRAWQKGISEAHACNPVMHTGWAKLVHLLRVLEEAEQLCQHGWDHPSLLAALQSVGSNPANPAQCPEVAQQQQQHPGSGSQLGIEEHPGLVLLRLTYLELMGEQAAYLDLAMAGQQWNHAVSALLRSGDRSQLQLAAQLLPRHITSLSQRLDYMQQLLEMGELGVVERCELAARLLLSLRDGLVPRSQQPVMDGGCGWWQVQVWEVPRGAQSGNEQQNLQSQLGTFLKTFFQLAGQAQFDLAKEAMAQQGGASGAGSGGGHAAAAAADAAAGATPQPSARSPFTDTTNSSGTVSRAEAWEHLQSLPAGLKECALTLLGRQQFDLQRMQDTIKAMLEDKWGQQLPGIWQQLVAWFRRPGPQPVKLPSAAAAAAPAVNNSPDSPLELDQVMLQYGEPWQRFQAKPSVILRLDSTGFVQGVTGVPSIDKVEPFPLPNLLPLCGLAPAALHTVVEGALAPVFDATLRSSGTPSSSRPGDLGARLLQVAGHPGVEYGGAAVRLQMAVEMVAYAAALTPVASPSHDPTAAGKLLFKPLLYGLLAMGQQELAWTVAKAAYRVCPGRFSATYLLLLAIQRGTEAQAAAVDWILGRDWPQGAGGVQEEEEGGPIDLTDASPQHSGTSAGNSSSLDTQQLLGSAAAEAIRLADTASSHAKRVPAYQAARARQRAALQRAEAGRAAPGNGALPVDASIGPQVRKAIRLFVEEAQEDNSMDGFPDLVYELANLTGLQEDIVETELEAIFNALDKGEQLIHPPDDEEYDEYVEDEDMEPEDIVDYRIHAAVSSISRLAQGVGRPPPAAAGGPARNAGAGMGGAAQARPPSPPGSPATLVLEHELLGATGAAWRDRASRLRRVDLQPVIQYAAACGLHPELVARLALVEVSEWVIEAAPAPLTWDAWVTQSRRMRGPESYYAESALTAPPQGSSEITGPLPLPPGASIQSAAAPFQPPAGPDSSVFAAWLLRWLEANSKETGHGSSSSKLGAGSSASEGVTSHHVSWLRQLWLLLQGRCYSPWMLWFAAALNRAGETQLACEAAAQGLLPGCCSYWGIKAVKTVYAACFKALLPQLVRLGTPAILQQAAATQLLLVQAPVPVEMLREDGVLKRLLRVTTQLAAFYMPEGSKVLLQVPASVMDLSTGHMSVTPGTTATLRTTLHACSQFMELLQRCVFAPLGAFVSKGHLQGQPGQQQPLQAESSPEEDTVVALLGRAVTKVHWSTALCIARAARRDGLICSWPGLVRALRAPLAAAAEAFTQAVAREGRAHCTTLDMYKHEHAQRLPSLVTPRMVEAAGWVNGVLAWVTVELGLAILDKGHALAIQPPPKCVEKLSSCLLGFHSPHVLPYAAAALQALQGRSTADITRALVPNGVLPLVGRPENLQACSTAGGPHGPYWAWAQPYYTQALHCLLQQGQMLASLPPDTIKNMAVTYFIKAGGLETTVWVGQLLTWIQQHASGAPQGAGTGQEAAGSSAGPMPPMADFQGDVLNLQVHPLLQPYLDLLPSTGPQAALQRFLHVQTAASRCDLQGTLSRLFKEPLESLTSKVSGAQFQNLEQQMEQLDDIFTLLEQQPYAGSPAVSWLQQQPVFINMQLLLRGLAKPSLMNVQVAAVLSPLLRLRVLQLKLWKLCRDIRQGPPAIEARITSGPKKPWEQKLTALQITVLPQPSYMSCQAQWEQVPDTDLQAAFYAARGATPGAAQAMRGYMVSAVLSRFEAQEVALAWAVLKYAELRGPGTVMLAELRTLVKDPTQLGQLPVFMSLLGAAVKQHRAHYALHALFRPVKLPGAVHQYLWQGRRPATMEQLQKHLAGKYNRLDLQQLMVQAIPWLDWRSHIKGEEVRALAEWLWWLAVQAQQEGVVGVHVATDQPVVTRVHTTGYKRRYPYSYFG